MVVSFDSRLLVTWVKRDTIFLEGMLCTGEKCPGRYSPYLLGLSFFNKGGLYGIYSLLSNGITLVAVFPLHYVEEEIIK